MGGHYLRNVDRSRAGPTSTADIEYRHHLRLRKHFPWRYLRQSHRGGMVDSIFHDFCSDDGCRSRQQGSAREACIPLWIFGLALVHDNFRRVLVVVQGPGYWSQGRLYHQNIFLILPSGCIQWELAHVFQDRKCHRLYYCGDFLACWFVPHLHGCLFGETWR